MDDLTRPAGGTLRLAIRCPCGRMPPIRITEGEKRLAEGQPAHLLKGSWQCKCGRLHDLTAAAYQRAA